MITCTTCGVSLEVNKNWYPSFVKWKKKCCKNCHNTYLTKLRRTSENYRKYERRYKENHRELIKVHAKKCRIKRRQKVLMIVGNGNVMCKRCGNTDIRILEINHINGGGNKEVGRKSSIFLNNILNGSRSTEDLEILCRPCNSIHGLESKYPDLIGKIKIVFEK